MPVLLSEVARMDYFISGLRVYRLVEITEFEATCSCVLFKHSTGWHEMSYTSEPHKLPLTLTVEPCILSPLTRKMFLATRGEDRAIFTNVGKAKDWVVPDGATWDQSRPGVWKCVVGTITQLECLG